MLSRTFRAPRRAGFTLIELLVVISIIAILVALTTAGVIAVLRQGAAMSVRGDINGLSTAHAAFCKQFHVNYIPSRIRLREDGNYNMSDPLDKQSALFLQSAFGSRLQYPIDWNGDGAIDGPHDLLGEECLVFFLGGIPSHPSEPNGCLGFSTNPRNPATPGGERYPPFFDFKSNRLVRAPNGFFMYRDAYNNPNAAGHYVYLSPRAGAYSNDSRQGVAPYMQSATRFINPNGFQIICAGRNGRFGAGGPSWTVAGGYGQGVDGSDDIANFSSAELAVGQQ